MKRLVLFSTLSFAAIGLLVPKIRAGVVQDQIKNNRTWPVAAQQNSWVYETAKADAISCANGFWKMGERSPARIAELCRICPHMAQQIAWDNHKIRPGDATFALYSATFVDYFREHLHTLLDGNGSK